MWRNTAGLAPKNLDHSKMTKTCIFWWFFDSNVKFLIFPRLEGIIFWKALSRAIIPEKMSKFWGAVQKIWLISWNLLKFFLLKNIFSTQNHSIRVKNMFSRFSIFFPKELPQTLSFFDQEWNFRFCFLFLSFYSFFSSFFFPTESYFKIACFINGRCWFS